MAFFRRNAAIVGKSIAHPRYCMSDERDWNFANADEAKTEIRAAVEYLLRGATGGARGDIVQEIIAIVRQVAHGLPPEQGNHPG
jgi:hypothetical protein